MGAIQDLERVRDQVKATLAECNTALTEKGADAAATLADVPERIAGVKDQWEKIFWETFQVGGTRNNYPSFGYGYWTDETFTPIYPIRFNSTESSQFNKATITNYEAMKMCDFSQLKSWNDTFRESTIPHLGVIDTRGQSGTGGNLYQVFYKCVVETVDEFILKDNGAQTFDNISWNARLKNIKFSGVIGRNLNMSACTNLTAESAISAINALADYSADDTKAFVYSVRFASTTLELLNAEGNTSPIGTTWLEYAQAKGWNV